MSVTPSNGRAAQISAHARDRWQERGDGLSIREAFALAARGTYTLPGGGPAYPNTKTYIYAPGHLDEELVFLVKHGVLVTVTPPRGRAMISRNLSTCPCCDGIHEFVADCGCAWCNETVRRLSRGAD
jgi:hypothetical protein